MDRLRFHGHPRRVREHLQRLHIHIHHVHRLEHCAHCPIAADRYCRGEHIRRFCEWLDPAHPDHNPQAEDFVRAQSERWGQALAQVYPSLAAQAGNALGAAVRFLVSGGAMVDHAELGRRLGICRACEHFDAEPGRCRVCGCTAAWKARLQTEHCPLPEPKW